MSSGIWTQCAGVSRVRELRLRAWRVVEAQHQVATRKLVGSAAEQDLLEEILERTKPPVRYGGRLHYLLFTPFRYPPLRHGSRFGTRHEPGIWYGSEVLRTAFAEVAYYRLLFLEGSRADLGPVATDLTAFHAAVRTRGGIDLTRRPFDEWRAQLASPTSYRATQSLGREMRETGVEAFRFRSARDREGGTNVGVFTPRAFTARRPGGLETWRCVATKQIVELSRRDYFEGGTFRFERDEFLVRGRLPDPALREA